MRTITTIAVSLAGVLSLAACGGKDTADSSESSEVASASEPAGDPCRFVTAEEMSAITTDTVTQLVPQETDCIYKTKHGDDLHVTIKTRDGAKEMENARRAVGVLSGMGEAVADKGAAGADVAAMLKKPTDTPKIGDDAVWGSIGILYARKGDAYVEVYPPNIHDPATHKGMPVIGTEEKRRISTAIAEKVFANLGR